MIEFLNKNVIEDILIKSGFEKGLLSMATRLLNEKLTKLLPDIIEGMTVSVDVSTNGHDSGNRLFGVVNEVMEDLYDKNGYTLLVYETEPNFDVDKTKVSGEEHNAAFEQWWAGIGGKDKYGYLLEKESAKEGFNAAITMNNICV